MMLYNFIIILTTIVLVVGMVLIIRMLSFAKGKKSWILIGLSIFFMAIALLLELLNLYFENNNQTLLTIYFILNLFVAVLLTAGLS